MSEERVALTQDWFDRLIAMTPDDVDLDGAVVHAVAWARAKGLFEVLKQSDDIMERDTDPKERIAAQGTSTIERALWYGDEPIPMAEKTLDRLGELVPVENDFARAVIYAVAKARQENEFEPLRSTYGFRSEVMQEARNQSTSALEQKVQQYNNEQKTQTEDGE